MDYGAMYLTAKKTKIKSLSKQSKFEGSDREVRGRIMKQLVKKGTITVAEVQQEFPKKEVEKILEGMISEGFVAVKGQKIRIYEH
jgi:A/G-specific adenine glycosylase